MGIGARDVQIGGGGPSQSARRNARMKAFRERETDMME